MNPVCTVDNCERPAAFVLSGLCRIHHSPTEIVGRCEVCDVEVIKPAGLRGGPRKRCDDHQGWKQRLCGACNEIGWTSHGNNKRCKKCSDAARSLMRSSCKEDACEVTQHAKGYCKSHYMKHCVIPKRQASRPTVPAICIGCGGTFEKTSKHRTQKYCTIECAGKNRRPWNLGETGKQNKKPEDRLSVCDWCHTMFIVKGKRTKRFCGKECHHAWAADKEANSNHNNHLDYTKRPGYILNQAIDRHDYATVITEAEKRVTKTEDGCWVWPSIDPRGYPKHNGLPMHRVMLEAKHQAPLGGQAAHHICANTTCVNPDHLQPVTHKDNTAEMLSRRAYNARIAELEQVIAEQLDRNHPVLHRVPLAQAV